VPPVRCILAEWQIVRARLLRSRLGVWLVLIGVGFGWLATAGGPGGLIALALRVGMLSAILCIAFCAGSDADRAALAITLTHPTTPLAVAAGRCIAAWAAALLVVLASVTGAATLVGATFVDTQRAIAAGGGAAGAAAGCELLLVCLGGNALAGVLFVHVALVSVLSPIGLAYLVTSPVLRGVGTAVLAVGPSLWRYRGLAFGDAGAWAHALGWMIAGVLLGAMLLGRRPR